MCSSSVCEEVIILLLLSFYLNCRLITLNIFKVIQATFDIWDNEIIADLFSPYKDLVYSLAIPVFYENLKNDWSKWGNFYKLKKN